MAPTHKLTLTNGQNTDDLKFSMEVNGIIEKNGSGTITDNVADETKSYSFRGTITSFTVHRGAGSVDITNENGVTESFRFQDLDGYDTRNGVSGDSGTSNGDTSREDDGSSDEGSSGGNDDTASSNGESSDEESSHDHSRIWSAIRGLKDSIASIGGGSNSGGSVSNVAVQNESRGLGVVSRPLTTQSDMELHVGNGCAYNTLQSAVNDVPHLIQHNVRIVVHGSTNDSAGVHIGPFFMAAHVNFEVEGTNDATIGTGVNINIRGKLDHIQFSNLTFEWVSQCIEARFDNCTFNGNGHAAFSGKEGGKMLINCTIGSGSDEYAVESIGNEMVELRNCTLNGNKAAVKGTATSVHTFTGTNQINAPEKYVGYANEVWSSGKRLD